MTATNIFSDLGGFRCGLPSLKNPNVLTDQLLWPFLRVEEEG